MVFQKGEHKNKLAVIVEIVDHNRVLVDGPSSGVPRHVASLKHVNLTKFVVEKVARSCSSKAVQKRFEEQAIAAKWAETAAAKKVARQTIRAGLTDFDRFKVMVLQKKRSRIVKA